MFYKTELHTIESINDFGDITVYNAGNRNSIDLYGNDAITFNNKRLLCQYDWDLIDILCRKLLGTQMTVIKGNSRSTI